MGACGFFLVAILDFTDVKNVTEGREGREGGKEGTRLDFLCGYEYFTSLALNDLHMRVPIIRNEQHNLAEKSTSVKK